MVEAAQQYGVAAATLQEALSHAPTLLERVTRDRDKYLALIRAAVFRHARAGDFIYHGHAGPPLRGLRAHGGLFGVGEGELSPETAPAAAPRMIAGLQPASAAAAPGTGSGQRELRGAFRLPPNVPVGEYSVELLGIRDEHAYPLATERLEVRLAGGVLALRRFAFEHGLLYGIAASVIATLAGLSAGLVLGSRSDKGH